MSRSVGPDVVRRAAPASTHIDGLHYVIRTALRVAAHVVAVQQEGTAVFASGDRQVWNGTRLVGKNQQATGTHVGVGPVQGEVIVGGEAVLQCEEVRRQPHHAIGPI